LRCPGAVGAADRSLISKDSPRMLVPHFVRDSGLRQPTSSANGAFGRHDRQDSAGMSAL